MSMYVAIQPENILRHLTVLNCGDGFLDRFLLLSCRPKMVFASVMAEKEKELQEGHLKDFVGIFRSVYKLGKTCEKCYVLSEGAQDFYDDMFDSYVEYVNKKYASDSESSSEENCDGIYPSGKDTIQVIRLSCVLHILEGVFRSHLDEISDVELDTEISRETMVRAHCLFNVLKQHKCIFMHSVDGAMSEMIKLRKVKSLQERVCAGVMRLEGPACLLRDLNKRLKGVLAGELKQELINLANEGFGAFEEVTRKKLVSFIFFKPSPASLALNDKYLKLGGFSVDVYTAKFNNVSKLSDFLRARVLKKHPHRESMDNILTPDSDSDDEFHDVE